MNLFNEAVMTQKIQRKRVLSICNISPNKLGSFEEFVFALTEQLKDNEFEHIIIFRSQPIKIVETTLLNSGATIDTFQPSNFNIYNLINIYQIVKKTRPDIIHFHFYPIYTVLNYLKFVSNAKIVYTDHMGSKKAKTFMKKSLRKMYFYTNSKFFDIGIDNIVCVSNFVKSKYKKEYGIKSNKLLTIYNGININRFKKSTEIGQIKTMLNIKKELVVTCVGLRKNKGTHRLIESAPSILNEIPNIKFILVGEGECREYIESLIKKFGIHENVKFVGNVSNIEEIYSISSCVVIPTLADEAFCFVAVEAMATETPIVAFDSGAIKEIISDKEKVISMNSKLLSDKVVECLKDKDTNNKNSREYVINNFSLDKCVYNYIELYEKLLS